MAEPKKQTIICRKGDEHRRVYAVDEIKGLSYDKDWRITVELFTRNRTLAQNNLLWKWHTARGIEFGETKEHEHHEFKRHHLLPILLRDDEDGALTSMHGMMTYADPAIREKFIDMLSTTMLSTRQFTEILNEYDMVTAQQGFVLPRKRDEYDEAMLERMPMRQAS